MSLNPLTPVTDYQSMLNRIFWFTSASALIAVWLLRTNLPALDAQLQKVDFALGFGGERDVPIPGGYLVPALAMGLGSRIFRIHGLIARWLGIRERFDIDVILAELAKRVDFDLQDIDDSDLVHHRHRLMRHTFYPFVGGSEPQIERQLIHRALDLWSWFWIGLEASFVFVLASFVLFATNTYPAATFTLMATLGLAAIGLPILRNECRRYAIAQVRAIVSDQQRAQQVADAFREILTAERASRLAA